MSNVEILRETLSVWQKGSSYPDPGSDVARLPFRFVLPQEMLPSCEYTHKRRYSGIVAYSIEVVGIRPGVLQQRKRITQALRIIPHSALGAELRYTLRVGWTGETTSWRAQKNIRKGVWGGYANVDMLVRVVADPNALIVGPQD